MAMFGLYRVYKHLLNEEGEVLKTKHVDSIWLKVEPRSAEEMQDLAKAYKGDELGSPLGGDMDFEADGNRRPKFNRQIVTNLRQSQPELKEFTDDQIYNAYDDYYFTADAGDESLIINYIQKRVF